MGTLHYQLHGRNPTWNSTIYFVWTVQDHRLETRPSVFYHRFSWVHFRSTRRNQKYCEEHIVNNQKIDAERGVYTNKQELQCHRWGASARRQPTFARGWWLVGRWYKDWATIWCRVTKGTQNGKCSGGLQSFRGTKQNPTLKTNRRLLRACSRTVIQKSIKSFQKVGW